MLLFSSILDDPIYLLVSGPVEHFNLLATCGTGFIFVYGFFLTHSIIRLIRYITARRAGRQFASGVYVFMDRLFLGDPYWTQVSIRKDIQVGETATMDGETYQVNPIMASLKGQQIQVLRCIAPKTQDTYHYVMPIVLLNADRTIRGAARYIWVPSWLETTSTVREVSDNVPKDINFFNA